MFNSTAGEIDGSAQLSGNNIATWNYAAQQFNIGALNDEVTSVSLMLQRSGNGGSYSIELWSNAIVSGTAVPGSLLTTLGTGSTSALSFGPALVTFNNGATNLSSNTSYWVVFNALGVGPGQVLWSYTADSTGTGVAGTGSLKTNDGADWGESYGAYRGIMSVTAVPEPSAYALAAAGLAVTWAMRARKRKGKAAA